MSGVGQVGGLAHTVYVDHALVKDELSLVPKGPSVLRIHDRSASCTWRVQEDMWDKRMRTMVVGDKYHGT